MERMGPYILKSVLGRGGMGTVYEAKHEETNEELAVKVLAPAYSNDEHFRNRFDAEIKALLKLDHPNIVRLISYGQEDQNLYFAMELVRGKSLFQMQRDGEQFDWREVIRIAKNISLGLRHAHDRGIIHRDLKPGNLIKAEAGIIKITDFGIAKRFGQDQNTGTNVLGTVDFMSPEQAKGLPVTFRSDLYSLGNVMYTLLAGQPPFTSNSFEESMRNLTKVPAPRIITRVPNVPQGLDDLIAQLLAKEPSNRLPTAQSLYHHLKKVEQDLLDSSRAVTTEREVESDASSDAPKTKVHNEPKTSVDRKRVAKHTVVNSPENFLDQRTGKIASQPKTTPNDTTPDLGRLKKVTPQEDFHKRVTDDQRYVGNEVKNLDLGTGTDWTKILLGATLFAVVILGGIGIYAASRTPSPDELLALINQSANQPQRRLDEINAFLKAYPDHELHNSIVDLRELAKCKQLLNRLSIRSRATGDFSKIEREFLDIASIGENELPRMVEKLKAFIVLNENSDDLEVSEQKCIDAARALLKNVKLQSEDLVAKQRAKISEQLQRAEKSGRQEARTIYESIIELNSEFEWVDDLIESARQKLTELDQKSEVSQ